MGFHKTSYLYSADGTKVQKIFGSTTTDYLDGFQYENEKLKFSRQQKGFTMRKEENIYTTTQIIWVM
ncbi:hypothetical protein U9K52_21205 [Chryseobacterium sp. MHB01]|uniref:hypothetical protein n=1 Tax=Chryseobacterium sp. MHB01 TaxID=3109433 RepID=UPI002AFEE325|nr:hypothetical protein [Chryseobacterium sp. MHB01]MEA1851439.1 hypothetical protein [Chryseobacterium sp. MHB01]